MRLSRPVEMCPLRDYVVVYTSRLIGKEKMIEMFLHSCDRNDLKGRSVILDDQIANLTDISFQFSVRILGIFREGITIFFSIQESLA